MIQGDPFSVYGAIFLSTLQLVKDVKKRREFEEWLVGFLYDVSHQLNSEGYGAEDDWQGTKEEFIAEVLDSNPIPMSTNIL